MHTVDKSLHSYTNTYRQASLVGLELAVHDDLKVICPSRHTVLVLVQHECTL